MGRRGVNSFSPPFLVGEGGKGSLFSSSFLSLPFFGDLGRRGGDERRRREIWITPSFLILGDFLFFQLANKRRGRRIEGQYRFLSPFSLTFSSGRKKGVVRVMEIFFSPPLLFLAIKRKHRRDGGDGRVLYEAW